ncbi:MAG: hypothetical protein JO102_01545, partial [Elusimicrobia bacterium]|nr:hypothetical protein [Elusimicrobiota bacterium]
MDIKAKRKLVRLKKVLRLVPFLLPAGVLAMSSVASILVADNTRVTAIRMQSSIP